MQFLSEKMNFLLKIIAKNFAPVIKSSKKIFRHAAHIIFGDKTCFCTNNNNILYYNITEQDKYTVIFELWPCVWFFFFCIGKWRERMKVSRLHHHIIICFIIAYRHNMVPLCVIVFWCDFFDYNLLNFFYL